MTYDKDKTLASNESQKLKKEGSPSTHFEEIKELLGEENECYVLITCGKPTKDGKMQVEMNYEGDSDLAAYLIESAQDFIE